jgi:lysozyme family protein
MANFESAYKITMKFEGGYSNDPFDRGGETYAGIARNFHPDWKGWLVIDAHKELPQFPDNFKGHTLLHGYIKDFYKEHYWDTNKLDYCMSQNVANEMFDTGVNMGVRMAAKFLQYSLNVLNKRGTLWQNITTDGIVGSGTLRALNACLDYRGDATLYKVMNVLQGNHYIKIMMNSEDQEKYAYGWFRRVDFIKN